MRYGCLFGCAKSDVCSTLTHWGRVTHICVSTQTIIGSDNGLSPGRRQAIIWTSAGILLIGPLGANFNEIVIKIDTFSFKKMHLKMSSGIWRLSCRGLNGLIIALLYVMQLWHNIALSTAIWWLNAKDMKLKLEMKFDLFCINTLRPRENGCHFIDIFKSISLDENLNFK